VDLRYECSFEMGTVQPGGHSKRMSSVPLLAARFATIAGYRASQDRRHTSGNA
jgi:hypothetical protein